MSSSSNQDSSVEDSQVTTGSRFGRNEPKLSFGGRMSYSVGHVLNDLCASMWFSYFLVYMHFVKQFHTSAGVLLLIGQVADGIATVFVGVESDRENDWWLCRYGRRKTWHLFGTVCVLCSFPFIFNSCVGCENSTEAAQVIYYAAFIVIFQFGWASVQISHLSLIPELTSCHKERVFLNASRYAFTVAANIFVYLITWLFLGISSSSMSDNKICPGDAPYFRNIVFSVVGLGALFSFIFHVFTRERPLYYAKTDPLLGGGDDCDVLDLSLPQNHLSIRQWFRERQFYIVGLLYMSTRLCINLTQVYIPLYLQDTLKLNKQSLAYIPLVMYCSGFVSSFVTKYLNVHIGNKLTYSMGALVGIGAYAWIYVGGESYEFKHYEIYAVAVVLGISGTTILVTSLAVCNDLIGHNTSKGAFVFGALSFLDKLSNGSAVIIIENLHPCNVCGSTICKYYYSYVLTFVCGGAALLGLISVMLFGGQKIGASISTSNSRSVLKPSETQSLHDGSEVSRNSDEGIVVDRPGLTRDHASINC